MNFILIVLILSKVIYECCISSLETTTLDNLWKIWKRVHDKHYTDRHEEVIRRRNWNENLVKIHLHNLRYDLGVETYEIGLSRFSDVDWNEFRSWYSVGDKLDIRESVYISDNNNNINNGGLAPERCDWRLARIVYEPRDQGSCNASYAFAVTYTTEIHYAIYKLKLSYLSVQQFIDCTHNYGNSGCHGGDTLSLLKYLQTVGLETEQMYPYTGVDHDCIANTSNVFVRSSGYKSIQNGNESNLKEVICTEGPYVVTMNIDENFLHYKSGIYQSDYCNDSNVNQSMAVIGYDNNEGIDYWILKNSWGTNWGENGFVYVRRNYGNMCRIASYAFAPVFNSV